MSNKFKAGFHLIACNVNTDFRLVSGTSSQKGKSLAKYYPCILVDNTYQIYN